MRAIVFTLSILLFATTAKGQFKAPKWHKALTGHVSDEFLIKTDDKENIYLFGSSWSDLYLESQLIVKHSTTPIDPDYLFLVKLDSDGKLIWAKGFNANFTGDFTALSIDKNEEIYVCGNYKGRLDLFPQPNLNKTTTEHNFFLAKFDKNGNTIFNYNYEEDSIMSTSCRPLSMTLSDNEIVIGGALSGKIDFDPSASQNYFVSSKNNQIEKFILKMDLYGKANSHQLIRDQIATSLRPETVFYDSAMNLSYIISDIKDSTSHNANGNKTLLKGNGAVLRTDKTGKLIWQAGFSSSHSLSFLNLTRVNKKLVVSGSGNGKITELKSGQVILQLDSINKENFLLVLDDLGNILSSTISYPGSSHNSDDNIILSTRLYADIQLGMLQQKHWFKRGIRHSAWVAKYDEQFKLREVYQYGSLVINRDPQIIYSNSDNDLIFLNSLVFLEIPNAARSILDTNLNSPPAENIKSYFIKYTNFPTAVESVIQNDFSAWPNPFNQSLNIEFTDPFIGSLSILDARGVVLHREDLRGPISTTIQLNLASGLYFVRAEESSGKVLVKKIVAE